MENGKKIQDILSNEDLTKLAVIAYLLTGQSFWSMLETIVDGEDDYLNIANERLKQIINDHQS